MQYSSRTLIAFIHSWIKFRVEKQPFLQVSVRYYFCFLFTSVSIMRRHRSCGRSEQFNSSDMQWWSRRGWGADGKGEGESWVTSDGCKEDTKDVVTRMISALFRGSLEFKFEKLIEPTVPDITWRTSLCVLS